MTVQKFTKYTIIALLLLLCLSYIKSDEITKLIKEKNVKIVINAEFMPGCGFAYIKKKQALDKIAKELKLNNMDVTFKMIPYNKNDRRSDFNLFVYNYNDGTTLQELENKTIIASSNTAHKLYFPFLNDGKTELANIVEHLTNVITDLSEKEIGVNSLKIKTNK